MEQGQLRKILETGTSILGSSDIDAITQGVADRVTDEFGFEVCDVLVLDEGHDNFVIRATKGYEEARASRVLGLSVSKEHFRTDLAKAEKIGRHTYLYKADLKADVMDYYSILHPERVKDRREHPDDWHELDVLYVMFEDGRGNTLGLMEPDGPKDGKIPGPEAVTGLDILAEFVSIALANASLVGSLNRTIGLFRALLDTTAAVHTPASGLSQTLSAIAKNLKDLVPFDEISVYLVDWGKNLLRPVHAEGRHTEEVMADTGPISGLAGEAVRSGKVEIVGDSMADPRVEGIPGIDELDLHRAMMAVPLKDRGGSVVGVLELYRDVGRKFTEAERAVIEPFASHVAMAIENVRLREELRENLKTARGAYEEMKGLDRMKDGLMDNISHELRTPLTAVMGYLEMLSSGMYGDAGPRMVDKLDKMTEQARNINSLVSMMRDMSALQSKTFELNLEEVNLAMVTREVLAELDTTVREKQHKVTVTFGNELPVVEADRLRMHDVIENMISNAIKYTDPGGRIEIGADVLGGKIHIWVRDNGSGIAEPDKDRVFDRFSLADLGLTRAYNRVGIGLFTSREIVRNHGGEMWFESRKGEGSTFHITVPFKHS